MRCKYDVDDLKKAVKNSKSIANVCRELKLRPLGGNYRTLKLKFKKYNIDTSHFTGQGWNTGLKFNPNPAKLIEKILVENSSYQSYKLKLRLFIEDLKQKQCEKCKRTKWNNLDIPLELNHINGNNTDNRLENLEVLCPNCHAQTYNHRGRNKLSALSEKREVEYRKFSETLTDNADGNAEPSSN